MARLVETPVFRRVLRVRDLIHAQHGEPLTLAAMAEVAGLSPFHLQRTFARALGESPHAYLTRVRLARAKELLRKDHASVTDVCLEVGFSSLGSFSTLFAREIGLSPAAYRREMQRLFQIPCGLPKSAVIPFCFLVATFEKPF